MKIFLSHANVDQKLASKVKDLLINISLGLIKPWLSSSLDGLRPGDVLWDEIHEHLKNADKIITILTPNSYLRPWLLYETGFIAGNKGANVIPIIFGIKKSDLPAPLSAYIIYSGDNKNELFKLLFQLLSEIVPNPNQKLIEEQLFHFENELPFLLLKEETNKINEKDHLNLLGIRLLDKLTASEILHKKLANPDIKKIVILTYTNEVEAGIFNHYRIKGTKEIYIYKRSIIADWSEQQKYNILRLSTKSEVKKWDKNKISFHASHSLEEEFKKSPEIKIRQFFYEFPPTKRSYIFNDNEAIIAYYERVEDPLIMGGAIYKGMNKSQSILISNTSEIGRYFINELLNYVETIQPLCHSWDEEKKAYDKIEHWRFKIKKPCISPKIVFLDMDGILYDSMPNYVKAWQEGFKEIGVNFPEIEVYKQEGRSSKETIKSFLNQTNEDITEEQIEKIIKKKKEVFNFFKAPVQKGALDLVKSISKSGMRMFVVTGSTQEEIKELINKDFHGLISKEDIITGNDYSSGKPNPAPYQMAAEKAGIIPDEAIVIENSPLGIESADRSGAFCIAINTGILKNKELWEAGARAIFDNLEDLANNWPEVIKILS